MIGVPFIPSSIQYCSVQYCCRYSDTTVTYYIRWPSAIPRCCCIIGAIRYDPIITLHSVVCSVATTFWHSDGVEHDILPVFSDHGILLTRLTPILTLPESMMIVPYIIICYSKFYYWLFNRRLFIRWWFDSWWYDDCWYYSDDRLSVDWWLINYSNSIRWALFLMIQWLFLRYSVFDHYSIDIDYSFCGFCGIRYCYHLLFQYWWPLMTICWRYSDLILMATDIRLHCCSVSDRWRGNDDDLYYSWYWLMAVTTFMW